MNPKNNKADLDDMLFENRERRYGAYSLRKSYTARLMIGTCSVLMFFILSAFTPNIMGYFGEEKVVAKKKEYNDFVFEDIKTPEENKEEEKIILPPKPPEVKIKIKAFLIPEPVKEDELENEQDIVEVDSLLTAPVLGLVDVDGSSNLDDIDWFEGEGDGEDKVIEEVKETYPSINDFIEGEQPRPTNMDDLRKLIGYPEVARDAGIEGSVVIRILVDKYGNYVKHKVIKKEHPVLSNACEKHISKLKFTPAIQGGKAIPFWVNIPFRFQTIN